MHRDRRFHPFGNHRHPTEDLLEQVWDEHADPFSNVVRVTVSTLRRKLGEPQVVQTVPRAGYRVGLP